MNTHTSFSQNGRRPQTPNLLLHVVGSIVRTLLGITFVFSGFVKAIDPLGTAYKIGDYLGAFGGFFTSLLPLANAAAIMLILFEFVLGVALVFNVWTKVTSWLSLAMMVVMTPLTLFLAITNPISDCGCFGDAVVLSNWQTFGKNVVLLALVVALLFTKKHIPNTFNTWVSVCILLFAIGFPLGFMTYTLNHLPVVDFRPYKIGNNIPELMEIPEDAPVDRYETTFIYEKEGVQKEFSLDNYPKNDPSWTFVDQRSVLKEKGFVPPIHDFAIETTGDEVEDITYDILESEDEVTLVVMYDLDKTDRKQAARLNALYEEAQWKGTAFYAVTGSGSAQIDAFIAETGAEYPFCTCDPITLKTIVRANPGIIVIQNGTIIDKYNLRNR